MTWEFASGARDYLASFSPFTGAARPPLPLAPQIRGRLRGDMTDRALLTTLCQTQSAFERRRGITVGHEGQVLSLPRSAPAMALSTLRNSRDASGPAPLLFIQAEVGAVVRGVKAGEFDYPT